MGLPAPRFSPLYEFHPRISIPGPYTRGKMPRASGILLHPTSLPGPYGIGELGPRAYAFANWLADAGQTIWQVLPLGPTGYGESPYQLFSAFAGNPLLISLDRLFERGLLSSGDLAAPPSFPADSVDFESVAPWK